MYAGRDVDVSCPIERSSVPSLHPLRQAWKQAVRQLATYFEGLENIERNTARELKHLGGLMASPLRSSSLLASGGIGEVLVDTVEQTHRMSASHSRLAGLIESTIIPQLRSLLTQIKAHIGNLRSTVVRLTDCVAVQREKSTQLVAELANGIAIMRVAPLTLTAAQDPHLVDATLQRQLLHQVDAENELQRALGE